MPPSISSYGTLLGTTFFHVSTDPSPLFFYSPGWFSDPGRQSFINGVVQFKVLERPQFSAVQTKLFPIYFSLQSAIPVVLALTYPGDGSPFGGPTGIAGVLDSSNRWSILAPLATIFVTGLANLVVLLPATQKCMAERRAQGEPTPFILLG